MSDRFVIAHYTLMSDRLPTMSIAQVADLHDRDPREVLKALKWVKPDLIVSTGDLMERHEPGMSEWDYDKMDAWQEVSVSRAKVHEVVKRIDQLFSPAWKKVGWNEVNGRHFIREASRIAPLYLSVGNHEWYFLDKDRICMKKAGATLLDNAHVRVELPLGESFLLGGFSTRYDMEWVQQFGEIDEPKILLCHHPDYFIKKIKNQTWDSFDLILSGHTHGGQWRLFNQPVFSPGQGVLPKHAYGMYEDRLIVSSGVANTAQVPRFGNPRELVVIDIKNVSEE